MLRQRGIDFIVGVFVIICILCLLFLAVKVSGLNLSHSSRFTVTANFQNIGDLKVRAPVTIAGVTVGSISSITLNPQTYEAIVTLDINKGTPIPVDSTANIYTAGLIGSNYISITPGFSNDNLQDGGKITQTNPALILQNLIGQLLYSMKGDGKTTDKKSETTATAGGQ